MLPTNLPDIKANELRADNVFLLEDDSLLIVDYESTVNSRQLLKYASYAVRVLEEYWQTKKRIYNVTIAIIYTSDIEKAPSALHLNSLKIDIQQVFLRNFDADDIVKAARARIEAGQALSDEETMKLIIAPLAKSTLSKQSLLEKCIDLAKNIDDDWQQSFLIAGMLVAADKFINRDYSHMLRRWLNMTKIGQLIQEEINEAAAKAAAKAATEAAAKAATEAAAKAAAEKKTIAGNLLRSGVAPSLVRDCTGLSLVEMEFLLENLD